MVCMLGRELLAAPIEIAGCLCGVAQNRNAGLKLAVWYMRCLIASLTPFFDAESESFSLYSES